MRRDSKVNIATVKKQYSDSFLQDFCTLRMAFVVILMAELLAIILTLSHSNAHSDHFQLLALLSLFIQWIALSSSSILCLAEKSLRRLSNRVAAVIAYILVTLTASLIIELSYWIFSQWLPILMIDNHPLWLIKNTSITAITAAIALRYFYVRKQWQLHVELKAQSHFQALQARIRPHFFFNCMNSIASLTRSRPEEAEKAIEDLADLFRASLMDTEELISLEEEIDLCRRYLDIELLRFGQRLQIEWHLELPETEFRIPPLIIQPLIENAIYHGIETKPNGGTIKISIISTLRDIIIQIQNSYERNTRAKQHKGNQIGQENIHQRILSMYGKKAQFITNDDYNYYEVQIKLPINHENSDR